MFPLIRAWINDWMNNPEADDLTRHRAHYDVAVLLGRSGKICTRTFPELISSRGACITDCIPDSKIPWTQGMANEGHFHGQHIGCHCWGSWGLPTSWHEPMLGPHEAPDSKAPWMPWMAKESHSHGSHMGCRETGLIRQGLHSISGRASHRKISWSFESARF